MAVNGKTKYAQVHHQGELQHILFHAYYVYLQDGIHDGLVRTPFLNAVKFPQNRVSTFKVKKMTLHFGNHFPLFHCISVKNEALQNLNKALET